MKRSDDLMAGLDDLDWAALGHAYGSAEELRHYLNDEHPLPRWAAATALTRLLVAHPATAHGRWRPLRRRDGLDHHGAVPRAGGGARYGADRLRRGAPSGTWGSGIRRAGRPFRSRGRDRGPGRR